MRVIDTIVGKLKSNKNSEAVPAGACTFYNKCGNLAAGGTKTNNSSCTECIDRMRKNNE